MSIRKRPGIVTRTQEKALEALGPLEDDGELEPLEKERRVPSSKMEDMSKNEGRVQKWRTGPEMEDGSRNGGRVQKWRTGPEMEDASRRAHTCPWRCSHDC
jgi:hypothetical protein